MMNQSEGTVTPRFTPTELTLLGGLVKEKVDALGAAMERLRAHAEDPEAWSILAESEDYHRTMIAVYAVITRKIELALDVPFGEPVAV